MSQPLPSYQRKSYMQTGELYFWTATIHRWQKLLMEDAYKQVIIDSLQYLSDKGKVDVYAFVIMPNHIHLIWRCNEKNGKESPQGSFLKYTAHEFKKMLTDTGQDLSPYKVDAVNKQYEFWHRDSLAVQLYTRTVAMQKLDYIHYNPLAEHWKLVNDPCSYKFSSASYYEMNDKSFAFLNDIREEF